MNQIFNQLVAQSADTFRLMLMAGKTAEEVTALQKGFLLEIGMDEDTAEKLSQIIATRATEGFSFTEAHKTALFDVIYAETQKLDAANKAA